MGRVDYVLADGFSLFCELPHALRGVAEGEEIVAARFRKTDQELVVLRPFALWEAHVRVRLDELSAPRAFPATSSSKLAAEMLDMPRPSPEVRHEQRWLAGIEPPSMPPGR